MPQPDHSFQIFSIKAAHTLERLPAMQKRRSKGGRHVRVAVFGIPLRGDKQGINISRTQILHDLDRLRSLDELGLIFFRSRQTLRVMSLDDIVGPEEVEEGGDTVLAEVVEAPEEAPEEEVVEAPEEAPEEEVVEAPEEEVVEAPEEEVVEAPVEDEPAAPAQPLADAKALITADLGRAKLRSIAEAVGAKAASSNDATVQRIHEAIDDNADALTYEDIHDLVQE